MERFEGLSITDAGERGLIPEASDKTLQALSYSEMKPYKHAIAHKWTVGELISTIKLSKEVLREVLGDD